MNTGVQDRKKLILAGSLGVIALGALLYTFTGGPSTPANTSPAPALTSPRTSPSLVAPRRSTALDPTLHPESMELTEQLVYSGSGRNIFSAGPPTPTFQKASIPTPIANPRDQFQPVTPVNLGPPPIDLRFFGTETRENGTRQAFFLRGEDVFLASEGDVVGRRYKVGTIAANSVEVTDLTNENHQRLPLANQ